MAKIPVKIDPKSHRRREVTLVVYVDGKEYTQTTQRIDEWAIPYIVASACTQLDDPDYDAAEENS